MVETRLYIARHGKTMFNTIGRAQGWSDTPLTAQGEEGIRELGLGLREAAIPFKAAFSSDSGRTIQTMDIILAESHNQSLPYQRDKRIREWCFGSLDGGYDGELFNGVLPRTKAFENGRSLQEVSWQEIADSLVEVDTAGWAEPWEVLSQRIYDGFEAIAKSIEKSGGGNAIVVSHGMTIGTFLWLIDNSYQKQFIDNGSVSVVTYKDGKFSIDSIAALSYREAGRKIIQDEKKA
ncbi:histidine phosphatase family protein [Streptococcus loxodontisalivarius]|uniref:Phosphoglycerate mutase n=1 Tax=Streptococcus loxodontisalivarius TaxID=1349415 RepID=A0ABS2PTC7_9STRE|nr:histidine phosphatase family protein [Streptococcus loxodontisalivarius]MBM7643274.1 putative phosphoglycerate mutase [Streptococcus loxodontisalivarius]